MINWKKGDKIISVYTPFRTGIPETNEWEIISKGHIKVLQCDSKFSSFLEVGKEYVLKPHFPEKWLQLWEVPIEQTKKPNSSGQVFLYDWNDRPNAIPSMEIDY